MLLPTPLCSSTKTIILAKPRHSEVCLHRYMRSQSGRVARFSMHLPTLADTALRSSHANLAFSLLMVHLAHLPASWTNPCFCGRVDGEFDAVDPCNCSFGHELWANRVIRSVADSRSCAHPLLADEPIVLNFCCLVLSFSHLPIKTGRAIIF
jgi:hypothetical protein